jgi:hypothetical protein
MSTYTLHYVALGNRRKLMAQAEAAYQVVGVPDANTLSPTLTIVRRILNGHHLLRSSRAQHGGTTSTHA